MSTGTVLTIVVAAVILYFLYNYFVIPYYLQEMTREYNELVDQFHLAVKETAVAYIKFGDEGDGMPITIEIVGCNGRVLIKEKPPIPSNATPCLRAGGDKKTTAFGVRGYLRENKVFVHSIYIEHDSSTIQRFVYDTMADPAMDSDSLSHPATWISSCSKINPGDMYCLVSNQAGLFTLQPVDPSHTPTQDTMTIPMHRSYRKTLADTTKY